MVPALCGILSHSSLVTMAAHLANKLTPRLGKWQVGSWLEVKVQIACNMFITHMCYTKLNNFSFPMTNFGFGGLGPFTVRPILPEVSFWSIQSAKGRGISLYRASAARHHRLRSAWYIME